MTTRDEETRTTETPDEDLDLSKETLEDLEVADSSADVKGGSIGVGTK